jgi:hypothetical protein
VGMEGGLPDEAAIFGAWEGGERDGMVGSAQ